MSDGFDIERVRATGPIGGDIDSALNHYYAAGGCVHLALAVHSIYPLSTRIAVQWYDDRGRRAIAHAVAYDPASGLGFDAGGCRPVDDALDDYSDQYDLERQMEADPDEIAEHMDIPWRANEPFDADGVAEAATFFEGHFLAPRAPEHWLQQIEDQMWDGAPDPRTDPQGYEAWFEAESMAHHHNYLKRADTQAPNLEALDAAGIMPSPEAIPSPHIKAEGGGSLEL